MTNSAATPPLQHRQFGSVTDYTPGAAITIDPGHGRPVHFIIGQKVQVLGPDGKVLAATDA